MNLEEVISGLLVVFLASSAFLLIATMFLMTWDDLQTSRKRKKRNHDRQP